MFFKLKIENKSKIKEKIFESRKMGIKLLKMSKKRKKAAETYKREGKLFLEYRFCLKSQRI